MRRLASAFDSVSSKRSSASSLSVLRYEACAPVIGSSPVFHSAGSFSRLLISLIAEAYPAARCYERTFAALACRRMDARALARQLAIGRVAIGGALVLTPALATRG